MKLLALDTATELCSAALWVEGAMLFREAVAPRQHGTLLLPMIAELLAGAELTGERLDAIAFGRGPGAFTGVRLAVAVAQGLAFAWERPVIPISDLLALAAQALPAGAAGRALVCQDARMEEVYWGCFERRAEGSAPLRAVTSEAVAPARAVSLPPDWTGSGPTVKAVGSGFGAYPDLQSRWQTYLGEVLPELRPRAREIAVLAVEAGLSAALPPEQAEAVYLRDQVTAQSSN